MVRPLSPKEADALMANADLDVIDVRDEPEFASGHVPRARNVPLAELKAEPKRHVPRDNVLLVCSRGVRSATAAS